MTSTYELVIFANCGMSKPDRIDLGKDKGKAISAYKSTHLGGDGNVVSVHLKRDGQDFMSKYLME